MKLIKLCATYVRHGWRACSGSLYLFYLDSVANAVDGYNQVVKYVAHRPRSAYFPFRPVENEARKRYLLAIAAKQAAESKQKTAPPRVFYIQMPVPGNLLDASGDPTYRFASNLVRTTKYTIYNFLVKNIAEQFRNVSNFFFLLIILLQISPMIRVVPPMQAAVPMIVITSITAIKDAAEDYRRYLNDQELNRKKVWTLSEYHNVNYAASSTPRAGPSSSSLGPEKKQQGTFGDLAEAQRPQSPPSDSAAAPTPSGVTKEEPGWHQTNWADLRVGDILLLKNDDLIPADVLVLSTSEPENMCYLETKNLDGETNLKIKTGLKTFQETGKDAAAFRRLCGSIDCQGPSTQLYDFVGVMRVLGPSSAARMAALKHRSSTESVDAALPPLNAEDLTICPFNVHATLWRGCQLRNTQWAVVMVLFTGDETRIRLNSGVTPSKRSRIDRLTNRILFLNLIILIALCLSACLVSQDYNKLLAKYRPVFGVTTYHSESVATLTLISFWLAVINFQNVIPISLYLTIELVKTLQSYFIHNDLRLYYPKLDLPCVPKSWKLLDDLGQIEYVFSDKTGTLTKNVMVFRKCSIGGIVYGDSPDAVTLARGSPVLDAEALQRQQSNNMRAKLDEYYKNPYVPKDALLTLTDESLVEDLSAEDAQTAKIIEFFVALAHCHTVLAHKDGNEGTSRITYKAQSPDEAALVEVAKQMGVTFLGRQGNTLEVDVMGTLRHPTVLDVVEFTSSRKRMSIIVRTVSGGIILFIKGADSVIYERLAPGQTSLAEATLAQLAQFATEGLRTLCLGYKRLSEAEYKKWSEKYSAASALLKEREETMERVADEIETDINLIGATAIEDALQDGVPESIAMLAKAGIKTWMLTGDKMETAINIGLSCNLLRQDMLILSVHAVDEQSTVQAMRNAQAELDALRHGSVTHSAAVLNAHEKKAPPPAMPDVNKMVGLVIDGLCLTHALKPNNIKALESLVFSCQAVICCRVSPLQKAQIVRLMKSRRNIMACAIGDGANDVSMIQAADVGVGIAGEEGVQAVMAADYAIAQFRYLTRLILVHGRWSYQRTIRTIFTFFFKNIQYVLLTYWFQFYSSFSLQPYWSRTTFFAHLVSLFKKTDEMTVALLGQFFNLLFTSVPSLILGVLDQDVDADISMRIPQLHANGMQQNFYRVYRVLPYILDGVWQSLVAFFFVHFSLNDDKIIQADGDTAYRYMTGNTVFLLAVLQANIGLALYAKSWTVLMHLFVWGSSLIAFAFLFLFDTDFTVECMRTPAFWFVLPLAVTTSSLPHLTFEIIQRSWYPEDIDIIREIRHLSARPTHSPERSSLPHAVQHWPQDHAVEEADALDSMQPFQKPKFAFYSRRLLPRFQQRPASSPPLLRQPLLPTVMKSSSLGRPFTAPFSMRSSSLDRRPPKSRLSGELPTASLSPLSPGEQRGHRRSPSRPVAVFTAKNQFVETLSRARRMTSRKKSTKEAHHSQDMLDAATGVYTKHTGFAFHAETGMRPVLTKKKPESRHSSTSGSTNLQWIARKAKDAFSLGRSSKKLPPPEEALYPPIQLGRASRSAQSFPSADLDALHAEWQANHSRQLHSPSIDEDGMVDLLYMPPDYIGETDPPLSPESAHRTRPRAQTAASRPRRDPSLS